MNTDVSGVLPLSSISSGTVPEKPWVIFSYYGLPSRLIISSSGFLCTFLESYDAKVGGRLYWTKEITVGDELSTCMWLKLGDGTWTSQKSKDYAYPVWLSMEGNADGMLIFLRGERDSLFLMYHHGYYDGNFRGGIKQE